MIGPWYDVYFLKNLNQKYDTFFEIFYYYFNKYFPLEMYCKGQ